MIADRKCDKAGDCGGNRFDWFFCVQSTQWLILLRSVLVLTLRDCSRCPHYLLRWLCVRTADLCKYFRTGFQGNMSHYAAFVIESFTRTSIKLYLEELCHKSEIYFVWSIGWFVKQNLGSLYKMYKICEMCNVWNGSNVKWNVWNVWNA